MSARGPAISLIALRYLHSKGLTDRQIADALRCDKSWAAAQRKKMGLAFNGKQRSVRLDRERIKELNKLGWNNDEIARELACSVYTIRAICSKLGLSSRIYKTRHLIKECENKKTVNYLDAIKQFRGLDVTDPAINKMIVNHNRSIELAEKGWHGRS
jgi:hypothetical protein